MDLKKAKWMAKARVRKVTGFFRYHYYDRLLHKGTEKHGSLMYVSRQLDLAKYDMTCDLEEEYRIDMGQCVEIEEMMPREPEEETEPGLLRERAFTCCVHQNGTTYIPTCVKDYENSICIWIDCVKDMEILEQKEITLSRKNEDSVLFFEMDGVNWSWEIEPAILRVVREDTE